MGATWIKLIVLGVVFSLGASVHAGYRHFRHPLKHTWECRLVTFNGPFYWFERPNKEVFEMYFDNPPKVLPLGMPLRDLTYTDDNADMRHFIKMQAK